MSQPLRVIFAGTPDFSVAPLLALLDSEHQVIAVYTQPDRPAGRGRKLTASPVKELALQHDIPVYQPLTLKDPDAQAEVAALNADIMIVVAYGLILPQAVLEMPKYGCLNIHASLLPRWRGAAPIQRAIQAGDEKTGVTIMQMDVGLDTGDMLYKTETAIQPEDSAQSLHDRLMTMGAEALITTLNDLHNLQNKAQKQDESHVTYAEKLSKAEAQIDWSQDATSLQRLIQAFNPWPVAFCDFEGKPLRIWQARLAQEHELSHETFDKSASAGTVQLVNKEGIWIQTGNGILCLQTIQAAGKKAMPAYDFAQSRQLQGQKLQ
ncbi:methionyl-tRNA formyltransferase [Thiomicrorhabdus sp. 6S3-12]|uniref:methionyl-tRNA formyltransferase n=1 Tax=Thiomicrorhabdus sp. 6S3-12 TaxID=2819681 RepID=UPI001AAD4672|nr:methionyl-tRNA formyltransferase [Thiomicrorhabdus sp. 6S3-12]MBO1924743.1 methionyl-tRNA formyltransferase [Thiomicrorhabdus sp. 6S3-12]